MSLNQSRTQAGPFLVPTGAIKKPSSPITAILTALFLLLMAVGMINLYAAATGGPFFYSQLRHVVFGLLAFFVIGWLVPIRHVKSYTYWIYGGLCFLLITVLLFGHTANGSTRWLVFGGMYFQPSELAKVALAMVVARFFQDNPSNVAYRLRDMWFIAVMVGVIFGLIFRQPDLGTAGLCLLIVAGQILFLKIDWRSVAIVGFSGGIAAVLGWNLLLHDYQRTRVLTLLNPDLDPSGKGYNALQSLVAVGSGHLFGKGYLQGTQTQLQFLPARHTDFVFSVFAEEHGFWACALVFAIFGLMTYFALEVARQAKDTFCGLLAVGIATMFFVQFAINVAMVLGSFPIVGMPLPLFSQGGSSLLSVCIAFGLLIAIHRSKALKGPRL